MNVTMQDQFMVQSQAEVSLQIIRTAVLPINMAAPFVKDMEPVTLEKVVDFNTHQPQPKWPKVRLAQNDLWLSRSKASDREEA